MTSDRKKPGVAFWATVGLAVVLLYVASFGPACWIGTQTNGGRGTDLCLTVFYWPILQARHHGPNRLATVLDWYACVGTPNGWIWINGFCHEIRRD